MGIQLIDKDELMKALNISHSCSDCEYKNGAFCGRASGFFVRICETICDAPTVSQWIRCSKKLPDEYEYVICMESNGNISKGMLASHNSEWFIAYPQRYISFSKVVAWMPIPEYKE